MPPPSPHPETLYNGHDLANAATQSRVHRSLADPLSGLRNGLAILGGMAAKRLFRDEPVKYELVTATGNLTGSDAMLTAVYAGTGANRAWCLSSVFDHYNETVVRTAASLREIPAQVTDLAATANFVFGDGIDGKAITDGGLNVLTLPAWVKQRLRVHPEWESQLKLMRRGTRQEIARVLRKQGYKSRLTKDRSYFESFYSNLYKPYATRRFSHGVLLVDRQRFMTECRRGIVLQLVNRKSVVGASLLRRVGNSLAIVWSALDPKAHPADLRGATDVLDYFSLLYAQLKGCRWLDFGPSRPDLNDGALRYKRKWGAEVTAGLVAQPAIQVALGGRHLAESDVLRRHAFISKCGAGLVAVAVVDGDANRDALRSKIAAMIVPGIDRYRIVAIAPISSDVHSTIEGIDPRIQVIVTTSVGDAIAAINR